MPHHPPAQSHSALTSTQPHASHMHHSQSHSVSFAGSAHHSGYVAAAGSAYSSQQSSQSVDPRYVLSPAQSRSSQGQRQPAPSLSPSPALSGRSITSAHSVRSLHSARSSPVASPLQRVNPGFGYSPQSHSRGSSEAEEDEDDEGGAAVDDGDDSEYVEGSESDGEDGDGEFLPGRRRRTGRNTRRYAPYAYSPSPSTSASGSTGYDYPTSAYYSGKPNPLFGSSK